MLVAFSIENYRSFREEQTMSLLAEDGGELPQNTVKVDVPALKGRRLLRSCAVYGPNGSGKSTIVRAFDRLGAVVAQSAQDSKATYTLPVAPFELDQAYAERPSRFTTTFVVKNVLYVYTVGMTTKRIHEEELVAYPKSHPQNLFHRQVNDQGESTWHFSRQHFDLDRDLQKRVRPNSLYVSVGAAFNHPQLTLVSEFFTGTDVREPRGIDGESRIAAEYCVSDDGFRTWASRVLKSAGTGLFDIRAQSMDVSKKIPSEFLASLPATAIAEISKDLRKYPTVEVAHVTKSGNTVWWSLGNESDGTRQLLSLLRSWYDLFNKNQLVIVDELDASLHSHLSRQLLQLLGSDEMTTSTGQLIFTTHDTTLLDPTLLRRDQIYFTEKDHDGATRLYSLLEYSPRKDEALQKGYLAGRYGAIPFLGELNFATPQKTASTKQKARPSTKVLREAT